MGLLSSQQFNFSMSVYARLLNIFLFLTMTEKKSVDSSNKNCETENNTIEMEIMRNIQSCFCFNWMLAWLKLLTEHSLTVKAEKIQSLCIKY